MDYETEEFIVIEQKDKHARLLITAAAIAGVAIGFIVGGFYTQSQWEDVVLDYQKQLKAVQHDYQEVTVRIRDSKQDLYTKIEQAKLDAKKEAQSSTQAKVDELNHLSEQLQQKNIQLQEEVQTVQQELALQQQQQAQLQKQLNTQSALFERARELFQKEFMVKQQLDDLMSQEQELSSKIKRLEKECNLYLEGQTWDVKSDVCSRHDATANNLSQVKQMISVNKMDLKQIETLSEKLGL